MYGYKERNGKHLTCVPCESLMYQIHEQYPVASKKDMNTVHVSTNKTKKNIRKGVYWSHNGWVHVGS